MKRQIMANANYWLNYLQAIPGDDLVPEPDLRGSARALEATVAVPEAWALTTSLALTLHPHMERRGYWSDWDGFLQSLTTCARRQADPQAEAELFTRQSTIQRQRGDYQAALLSSRRAWHLFRQMGDQLGRARTLSNLGDLYRLQEYFWRAETLCQEAVTLFESQQAIAELAQSENRLGLVYFDQGRWDEALPHLTRAETLWQQVGDRHGLAKALHNLGELHRRIEKLEEALNYFQEAIHYYQMVGDEIHVARVQLNIGNIYLEQSKLPQAEATYTQAETILRRVRDRIALARAHHNLGMVYTQLGDWNEAEACFERAVEEWRSQGDTWNLANALGEFACLHLACGRRSQAQACLDQAWQLVSERPEGHYELLRRELAERRLELSQQPVG